MSISCILRGAAGRPGPLGALWHSISARHVPRQLSTAPRCFQQEQPTKPRLTESYCHTPSDWPLVGLTVGQALDLSVEKFPEKTAFVYGNDADRQTYTQLKDEVDRFAAGLVAIGITKGDRVGIWGPNSREWIITQYATARIGAILVNVNPAYRTNELEYALKKVGVKAIVSSRSFKTQEYYEMLREACGGLDNSSPGKICSQRLPDLKSIILMGEGKEKGTFSFDDVIDTPSEENRTIVQRISQELQFDDPINIQFTSGTTGLPKATILSHHGIVNCAINIGHSYELLEKDTVMCVPIPLYHCAGMIGCSATSVVNGITCVIPSPSFEPAATLEAIQNERCTMMLGIPTIFIMLLNHPGFESYDVSSLRMSILGGAPCLPQVLEECERKFGMAMLPSFGITECTLPVTYARPDDPSHLRVGAGRPFNHVEVKIVDVTTGNVVPVNEQGELCVRGYNVMKGYWDDAEKTKAAIDKDGWLHTGDIASMTSEGNCTILARLKDMVIRGGTNIFPAEIEQFIYGHNDVENVQVVGIPDDVMGEELCACIKLKPGATATAEDIRAFCKGKITHYKIPRYIEFVDSYPMTASLKVKKFELQRIMSEKLGP